MRDDFQRLLIADGVSPASPLPPRGRASSALLHPRDRETGVHYSLLPMIHAILVDLFTPEQARRTSR